MIGQIFATVLVLSMATVMTASETVRRDTADHKAVVMAAAGAPASMSVSGLAFSESVSHHAQPDDASVEFNKSTDRIWVSFDFSDFAGERMSFIARANGSDWKYGDLECCEGGSSGRFAFPLERQSGKPLGGAAYEVRIYAGDAEIAVGGFGVKGTKAFDDEDDRD